MSLPPNRRRILAPLLIGATTALLTLWVGLAAIRDPYHLPVPTAVARGLSLGVVIAVAPFGGVQNVASLPLVVALGALVNGFAAAAVAAVIATAGRAALRARRQSSGAHVT